MSEPKDKDDVAATDEAPPPEAPPTEDGDGNTPVIETEATGTDSDGDAEDSILETEAQPVDAGGDDATADATPPTDGGSDDANDDEAAATKAKAPPLEPLTMDQARGILEGVVAEVKRSKIEGGTKNQATAHILEQRIRNLIAAGQDPESAPMVELRKQLKIVRDKVDEEALAAAVSDVVSASGDSTTELPDGPGELILEEPDLSGGGILETDTDDEPPTTSEFVDPGDILSPPDQPGDAGK